MDRYTKYRGGSSLWTDESTTSTIINTEFFGAPASSANSFWIKVAGVWKQCTAYIKVAGVWKSFIPKIKVTGTWK